MRRQSILRILAVTVIMVVALGGLTRGRTGDSVDATPQPRRSLVTSVITPVGHDRFSIVPIGSADATITSPMTNVDSNLREVFWDANAPDIVDGGSCATWQSASTADLQQGIALRAQSSPAAVRAILITKNVWFDAPWVFNIDVWDTGTTGLTVVKSFDLQAAFSPGGRLQPLPWRMCARARANLVEFKVWPASQPEPAWGDARFGGSSPMPSGWQAPGKAGWYIGHLPPGAFVTYHDMLTYVL